MINILRDPCLKELGKSAFDGLLRPELGLSLLLSATKKKKGRIETTTLKSSSSAATYLFPALQIRRHIDPIWFSLAAFHTVLQPGHRLRYNKARSKAISKHVSKLNNA